jgi:hypothetical protein
MSRFAATPSSVDDDRPARYTFSTEHDDDDDDESSAEDVFAFLPPSTADGPQHQYPPLEYPAPVYDPSTPLRVSLPSTEKSNVVRPDSFAGTGSEEGSIKWVLSRINQSAYPS